MTEIALLDQSAKRQEIELETYQKQRAELVAQAKILINSNDPAIEGIVDK